MKGSGGRFLCNMGSMVKILADLHPANLTTRYPKWPNFLRSHFFFQITIFVSKFKFPEYTYSSRGYSINIVVAVLMLLPAFLLFRAQSSTIFQQFFHQKSKDSVPNFFEYYLRLLNTIRTRYTRINYLRFFNNSSTNCISIVPKRVVDMQKSPFSQNSVW